jgi:hypothetical protein
MIKITIQRFEDGIREKYHWRNGLGDSVGLGETGMPLKKFQFGHKLDNGRET